VASTTPVLGERRVSADSRPLPRSEESRAGVYVACGVCRFLAWRGRPARPADNLVRLCTVKSSLRGHDSGRPSVATNGCDGGGITPEMHSGDYSTTEGTTRCLPFPKSFAPLVLTETERRPPDDLEIATQSVTHQYVALRRFFWKPTPIGQNPLPKPPKPPYFTLSVAGRCNERQ